MYPKMVAECEREPFLDVLTSKLSSLHMCISGLFTFFFLLCFALYDEIVDLIETFGNGVWLRIIPFFIFYLFYFILFIHPLFVFITNYDVSLSLNFSIFILQLFLCTKLPLEDLSWGIFSCWLWVIVSRTWASSNSGRISKQHSRINCQACQGLWWTVRYWTCFLFYSVLIMCLQKHSLSCDSKPAFILMEQHRHLNLLYLSCFHFLGECLTFLGCFIFIFIF